MPFNLTVLTQSYKVCPESKTKRVGTHTHIQEAGLRRLHVLVCIYASLEKERKDELEGEIRRFALVRG